MGTYREDKFEVGAEWSSLNETMLLLEEPWVELVKDVLESLLSSLKPGRLRAAGTDQGQDHKK